MSEVSCEDNTGYIIRDYILDEFLKEGGFGKAYKAHHKHRERLFCLKESINGFATEEQEDAFLREGQILDKLEHKNIVRLHDLFSQNGKIYVVMDYVDGGDLSALLKKTPDPLPLADVDHIVQQIAEGLHYVHSEHHIIHRDLKPQNILRYSDGRIVIADFGLAKIIDETSSKAGYSHLSSAGTPAYMAPEHIAGKASFSSDLYSLGVITYQLLTKQVPFGGGDQAKEGHLRKAPPPLSDFNLALSPEIEQVVLKMLAKKPEERYANPIEFARALHYAILKESLRESPIVNPENIHRLLKFFGDGETVIVEPGDYRGPFTLDKCIHMIGSGSNTRFFALDEPVFVLHTSGICLESMLIQRTPEDTREPAIQADKGISYQLKHAIVRGSVTEGAHWEDAEWQLPVDGIDFGPIPVESIQERKISIEVKVTCRVETDMPGLAVFPAYLAAGVQMLALEYDARGKIPGLLLEGIVRLSSATGTKTIAVTGQVELVQAQPVQEEEPSPLDVPYVLQSKAAQDLLRMLGSDEERDLVRRWENEKAGFLRRKVMDRAGDLFFEITDRTALIWYVRRMKANAEDDEEEIWELTLATEGFYPLEELAAQNKTLRIFCTVHREGRGKLTITSMCFPKIGEVREDFESLSMLLKLVQASKGGIPQELLQRVLDLPIEGTRELDGNQLQGWEALLQFQIDQVKKRQYWVRYTHHTYRNSKTKVTFSLDKDDIKDAEGEAISFQDFLERTRKTKREMHLLLPKLPEATSSERKKRNQKDQQIGTLEDINTKDATATINLTSEVMKRLEDSTYQLPGTGYLHYEAFGDIQQYEKQWDAISDLQQGKALNPALSDFFFDASRARSAPITKPLQATDLLSGTCNDGQIAAIEVALAAPDLVLLQGPPGTGKTTVIAEICYQVARTGGRVLIASQSNLAVDNALGRLIHRPEIRALRKGNPTSVEDEGREFTEDNVVQRWVTHTANDCQKRLDQRTHNILRLKQILSEAAQFSLYYATEEQWENKRFSLQKKVERIKKNIDTITQQRPLEEAKIQQYAPLQKALSIIVTGDTERLRQQKKEIFQDVFQYIKNARTPQTFMEPFLACLQIMPRVDLTLPPQDHLLQGLVWLKKTASASQTIWTEAREYIELIHETMVVLKEAEDRKKRLESSVKAYEMQQSQLNSRMDASQKELWRLKADRDVLQEEETSLANFTSRLTAIIQNFIHAQLGYPVDPNYRLDNLSLEKILAENLTLLLKRYDSATFLAEWNVVDKAILQYIYQSNERIYAYKMTFTTLSHCEKMFEQQLYNLPEIHQRFMATEVSHNIPVVSDQLGLNSLVNMIKNYQSQISTMLTKPPSIFDQLLKEHNNQQLLGYMVHMRNLFLSVNRSRGALYNKIRDESSNFAYMQAKQFSQAFQNDIQKCQRQIEANNWTATQQKEQLNNDIKKTGQKLQAEVENLSFIQQTIQEQIGKFTPLFQDLYRSVGLPQALRGIVQPYTEPNAPFRTFLQDHYSAFQSWLEDTRDLQKNIVAVWDTLTSVAKDVQAQYVSTQKTLERQQQDLERFSAEQKQLTITLQDGPQDLRTLRTWWSHFWEKLPKDMRPLAPEDDIYALPLLATMEQQFRIWQEELAKEEAYARRYNHLTRDWIDGLGKLSEDDRQELQSAYIKNANVIGITCGQVHRLNERENKHLARFNVVIIDEVSKATPPEILLAALKGKKLILIGDQRQLPPMIEDKTLEQLAEESGQSRGAFRYLNRPYFEQRFNEAPDAIKRMLYIQYRMHPDIMAAINQFYNRPLECGLNQPNLQRDHQFDFPLVLKDKHLIWVSTPLISDHTQNRSTSMIHATNRTSSQAVFSYESRHSNFGEEKVGTSYVNHREVELITKICEELNRLWIPRVAAGMKPKEIGVITFYAAQMTELQRRVGGNRNGERRFEALDIRVGSVDRFQGIERPVVIVSMVRNNRDRDIGFAKKDERINVAFSRAQELLMIVGCHDLFCVKASQEGAAERYRNVAKVVKNRGDFIDILNV